MSKHKTAVQKSFETKVDALLTSAVRRRHPESGKSAEVLIIPSQPLDVAEVEKVFFQYGTSLELVGGDAPVEKTQVFEFPRRSIQQHNSEESP